MFSSYRTHLVLLIATSMFLAGCSLKPKLRSRFHSTTADSCCSCYTCRTSANSQSSATVVTPITEKASTSAQAIENPAVEKQPSAIERRSLHEAPVVGPIVSTKPFQTPDAAAEIETAPVVADMQPENSPSDEVSPDESVAQETKADEPESTDIAATGTETEEATTDTDETESTFVESDAIATDVTVVEEAESAEEVVEHSIGEGGDFKSAEADTNFIEAPQTDEPVENPVSGEPGTTDAPDQSILEPATSFNPDNSSKPLANTTPLMPLDSDWKFGNETAHDLVESPEETVDVFGSSLDGDAAEEVTQSPPTVETGGKVVLKAHPVERNVVYMPSPKSAIKASVPALQSSFKNRNPGNWLREVPRVAEANVIAPARITPQPVPQTDVAQTQQPRSIPVRLRAIPMDEKTIKGKQVEVRFRETAAAPQDIEVVESEITTPNAPVEEPVAVALPAEQLDATSDETIDLTLDLDDAEIESDHEHTAKVEEEEFVTPPWRIK